MFYSALLFRSAWPLCVPHTTTECHDIHIVWTLTFFSKLIIYIYFGGLYIHNHRYDLYYFKCFSSYIYLYLY